MSEVEISITQQKTIQALQKGEAPIPMKGWLAKQAAINYEVERALAEDDPAAFWGEKAKALDWAEPWTKVLEFNPPQPRLVSGRQAQRHGELHRPSRAQ